MRLLEFFINAQYLKFVSAKRHFIHKTPYFTGVLICLVVFW